jgi:hypothetical protein
MHEKLKRNQSLYEYHLKHPKTGCTKLGRIFRYRDKDGKMKPLHPSRVLRIIKMMEQRATVDKGMDESQSNETIDRGSFAKYVKIGEDSCVEVENGEHK